MNCKIICFVGVLLSESIDISAPKCVLAEGVEQYGESDLQNCREEDLCGGIAGTLWCWFVSMLWRERCRRIFQASSKSSDEVLRMIVEEVQLYSAGDSEFCLLLDSSSLSASYRQLPG
ncbi:unnamed protein product [Linum trigynum]